MVTVGERRMRKGVPLIDGEHVEDKRIRGFEEANTQSEGFGNGVVGCESEQSPLRSARSDE